MEQDNKYLTILETEAEKQQFIKMQDILAGYHSGHTRIQIENFILNDIEYPTDYGKWQQARVELVARYWKGVQAYYDIEREQINLAIKKRDRGNEKDELKAKLLDLDISELELKITNLKLSWRSTLYEASIFLEAYNRYPKLHNMAPEQEQLEEQKQWAEKARLNPEIFDERYGPELLKQMWGEDNYKIYLHARRKFRGILGREMVSVNRTLPKTEGKLKQLS